MKLLGSRCFFAEIKLLPSMKRTASLHLKMDIWNDGSFPFGFRPIFRGEMAVSFRECIQKL